MTDSRVVVTGGNGNLGRATVAALLDAGHEVLILDRAAVADAPCATGVIDIGDAAALAEPFEGAAAIIHLAAYQAPYEAPHAEVFRNNVSATYNVMKTAAVAGVRRVVHVSSVAAYGFLYAPAFWPPEYLPLDEAYPCRPRDPYALAKVFGEQMADSFVAMSDMTVASLRVTGVNFDPAYASLPERWKDPGAKIGTFWSYIDARDAAAALALAAAADIDGHEIFNIAHPESRYPQETNDLVAEYLPGTRIRDGFTGHWGGLDVSRARERLGFMARHHWRDVLGEDGNPV